MTTINKIRQRLLITLRQKAFAVESSSSKQLLNYRKSYHRYARRDHTTSNLTELLSAIEKSQIIYMGDFHSFDQNSKNFNRLLSSLLSNEKNLYLGVEFIDHTDQNFIDLFLDDKITERDFLESIDYHKNWRFPWKHYKTFFLWAKDKGIKIVALNSSGQLAQRDQFAAKILSSLINENPSLKILVLFGEYHLAPNKLPQQVKKLLNKAHNSFKQTIVHQNLDEIYLKDLKNNNSSSVVKFNDNEFSLQNAPAWIKYESMISWYENITEDPDFDLHEYENEQDNEEAPVSYDEQFVDICRQIASGLKIEISDDLLEDFQIYGQERFDFVLEKIENLSKKSLSNLYKTMLVKGKTFKLPLKSEYYYSNYSINRISFLAGTHIHYKIQNKQHFDIELLLYQKESSKKFLYFCYQCMFAYLSSKIINPFKKCHLYLDISERINDKKTNPKKAKNLLVAQKVLDRFAPIETTLKGQSLRTLYSSAKTVGNLLADTLYDRYFNETDRDKFFKIVHNMLYCDYSADFLHNLIDEILPKNYQRLRKRIF